MNWGSPLSVSATVFYSDNGDERKQKVLLFENC